MSLSLVVSKPDPSFFHKRTLAELKSVISHEPVDEVFVALPLDKYGSLIEAIVRVCEEQGIPVKLRTQFSELRLACPRIDELQGIPMITFQSGPRDGWRLVVKRLVDILASVLLLVLLAPILVAVALLIRLDSSGPSLFTQERVGWNKRRFKLFKYRTMVYKADEQQHLVEHLNEADGPVFKIKEDPRITPVGRFLRRYSIDELPQLINVLVGDMSLVGPRPLPLRDVNRIRVEWHRRRFSVKPGVTCLWQINGRSNVDFDRWVRMDLDYIDRWSIGLDFKILLKTIPAVFKGSGAY